VTQLGLGFCQIVSAAIEQRPDLTEFRGFLASYKAASGLHLETWVRQSNRPDPANRRRWAMLKTILVPLDGSSASEQALPLAVSLARRANACLRLVTVRPPMPPTSQVAPPPKEQDYVDMVAWRIRQTAHLSVFSSVLDGPIAKTLGDHALSVGASLIVMTTHGRGPFSRFWLGSVTDQLLRNAPVPLLVVRPRDTELPPVDRDWAPRSILVPLDGSPLAERALCHAAEIAKLTDSSLRLFRVIEPIPVLAPDGLIPQPTILDASVLDELKTQARTYLEGMADKLRKDGLKVNCRIAIDDRTAQAILEEGREDDLIALASHARHGVARILLGSVADKLVRGATSPVLVARPEVH
jgi:nucleotide-binding universal stress UspA family protein